VRGTLDWSRGGAASRPGVDERLSSIATVLEPVWTTKVSSNVRIDGPR